VNAWDLNASQAVLAPRTTVLVFGSFVAADEEPPPPGASGFPMRFMQPRTE
jgi:hypothetical protein